VPRLWRAALAIAITLAVWVTTPVTTENGGFDSDAAFYARLVDAPLFSAPPEVPPPYVYRVLTPRLVSWLPGPLLARFRTVALVADIATLALLFELFAAFDVGAAAAVFGVLLYAGVFWTLKFSFFSPGYVDHVTGLLLVGFVYLTARRRYVLATLVLAVSALQKESLPLFGVFLAADIVATSGNRVTLRQLLGVAAALTLPIATVLLVHLAVGVPASGTVRNVLREGWRLLHPRFWPVFLQTTFSGLGLIPLALLSRRQECWAQCRRRPALVVFLVIAAAFLLGGVDKGRLFQYALPVLALLAAIAAESLAHELRGRFWIWAVVFLTAHFYLGNYLSPIGPRTVFLAKLVPEHVYAPAIVHLSRLYLARDCGIAVAVFLFTLWMVDRRPAPLQR